MTQRLVLLCLLALVCAADTEANSDGDADQALLTTTGGPIIYVHKTRYHDKYVKSPTYWKDRQTMMLKVNKQLDEKFWPCYNIASGQMKRECVKQAIARIKTNFPNDNQYKACVDTIQTLREASLATSSTLDSQLDNDNSNDGTDNAENADSADVLFAPDLEGEQPAVIANEQTKENHNEPADIDQSHEDQEEDSDSFAAIDARDSSRYRRRARLCVGYGCRGRRNSRNPPPPPPPPPQHVTVWKHETVIKHIHPKTEHAQQDASILKTCVSQAAKREAERKAAIEAARKAALERETNERKVRAAQEDQAKQQIKNAMKKVEIELSEKEKLMAAQLQQEDEARKTAVNKVADDRIRLDLDERRTKYRTEKEQQEAAERYTAAKQLIAEQEKEARQKVEDLEKKKANLFAAFSKIRNKKANEIGDQNINEKVDINGRWARKLFLYAQGLNHPISPVKSRETSKKELESVFKANVMTVAKEQSEQLASQFLSDYFGEHDATPPDANTLGKPNDPTNVRSIGK